MVKAVHEIEGVGRIYDFEIDLGEGRICKGNLVAENLEKAWAKVDEYRRQEFPSKKWDRLPDVKDGTIVI